MFPLSSLSLLVLIFVTHATAGELSNWLITQKKVSIEKIDQAVCAPDSALGAVFASPSKSNPNYYYHWVRDAALTAKEMLFIFDEASSKSEKDYWLKKLKDYAAFSRRNQLTDNMSGSFTDRGLGEPRFSMTGPSVDTPWGRPQNDGPALRALTLIELAYRLIQNGEKPWVEKNLYTSEFPANTAIKADLEYVSHHWQEPCFDLWEEVRGNHFYTRVVQMQALKKGATLARLFGDPNAADWYESQARQIQSTLSQFWTPAQNFILATTQSERPEKSTIDMAVVLAVLESEYDDGNFSMLDSRVHDTLAVIESLFSSEYKINQIATDGSGEILGTAFGRYPRDTYDGLNTNSKGNPWFLTTHAVAEFHYRMGRLEKGDTYLRRSMFHTPASGSQSEQIQRDKGVNQGAIDLTWSYASFLSALRARSKITNKE